MKLNKTIIALLATVALFSAFAEQCFDTLTTQCYNIYRPCVDAGGVHHLTSVCASNNSLYGWKKVEYGFHLDPVKQPHSCVYYNCSYSENGTPTPCTLNPAETIVHYTYGPDWNEIYYYLESGEFPCWNTRWNSNSGGSGSVHWPN